MRNLIQVITSQNEMLTSVFQQMEFFVKRRSQTIVANEGFSENQRSERIAREREVEEILAIDFLKAFSNYCNSTDVVEITGKTENAKGFNVVANVVRNGETYRIETDLIIAGGAVQRLHYRYIVKTDLPKESTNVVADKMKKVTKFEKAIEEFKQYSRYLEREEINKLEAEFLGNVAKAKAIEKYIKDINKKLDKIKTQISEMKAGQ